MGSCYAVGHDHAYVLQNLKTARLFKPKQLSDLRFEPHTVSYIYSKKIF